MTPEEAYSELLAKTLGPDEVSVTGTLLTKSQLEAIVGKELDHDDVYANDTKFTEEYKHLVVAYGFTSFYPLYVMAEMNELERIEKAGRKDFSRLHKVKRTVIRNGKPMQTTIYSDPDEGDNEKVPEDNSSKTSKGSSLRNARDMTRNSSVTTGKDLKDLISSSKGLEKREGGRVTVQGLSGATGAFTLTDELGETRALVTFSENDKYVYIQDIADDGETSGIGLRAFFELLAFAKTRDKGLKVDDTENPLALNLFKHFNLSKKNDGTWVITRSNLNDILGDLPWMNT